MTLARNYTKVVKAIFLRAGDFRLERVEQMGMSQDGADSEYKILGCRLVDFCGFMCRLPGAGISL